MEFIGLEAYKDKMMTRVASMGRIIGNLNKKTMVEGYTLLEAGQISSGSIIK